MADYFPHGTLLSKSHKHGDELVTRFVDFSSKYGLGYMLSNGAYGVLFNDCTKIVTHENLFHFVYFERVRESESQLQTTEQKKTYNMFDYPAAINKKVVLLQHFKSYLDGNSKFKPMTFPFTKVD